MSAPQFRFRLQRLLDLRALAERQAAIALAAAQSVEDQARRERDALDARREAAREMLMPPAGSHCRVSELRQVSVLLERLDAGSAQAAFKVSKAENQVHQKRLQLGESVTNRRVLDRLKDRQHEDWRVAEERAERAVMDDIGRSRFAERHDPTQHPED